MFCPQCGAEYQEGIVECADCERSLVAQPPREREHPDPGLVTLAEIYEPTLLPVIVGLLRSAGIEPVVEGDEIMGLWPLGQAGAGWTRTGRGLSAVIRVADNQLEEARALLSAAGESADGESADGEAE